MGGGSKKKIVISSINPYFHVPVPAGPHKDGDERVYHAYYQWVPLVLAFQALFFYAPHWIWKQLEGGRFKVSLSRTVGSGSPWQERICT